MDYARLGSTDVHVSRIGFGCAVMGGWDYGAADDHESIAAVHAALDQGINFFDTADVYGLGHAEEVLGRALKSQGDDVVVATKFGVRWDDRGRTVRDCGPDYVVQALEASLRRLGRDTISLYQIHWPDDSTPIEATMEALERCRAQGKIQVVGCCNFSAEQVADAQRVGRLESLQVPYSLGQRETEALISSSATRHEMGVLCYNPLAQGLYTGKFSRDSILPGEDLRSRSALFQGDAFEANLERVDRLRAVGERVGKSPAQVAVRWVLENPAVTTAITGVRTARQARENAGGAGWRLEVADRQFLTAPVGDRT